MKKSRKISPALLLLVLSILFACATCEKYDDKTYYKAKGEGYIFMCDSAGNILHPIEGAYIYVHPRFDYNSGWFAIQPDVEWYYSDVNGKYQVSFLKRAKRRDVTFYLLSLGSVPEGQHLEPLSQQLSELYVGVDIVKNAQNNIIVADTIKLYRRNF